MDSLEFIPVASRILSRWWAFPIPPEALDGYTRDLADLPVAMVLAAVDALSADGMERAPTSGQIRRRVAELELNAPTWDQVRTAMVHWRAERPERADVAAAWECPAGACDGSAWLPAAGRRDRAVRPCACRPAYLAALRGLGLLPALIAEFVTGGHVASAELDRMLVEGDSTAEAQIRGRWVQFVARAIESRVYAGLPGVGVARLDAAREETTERERRHGALRRLDPVALLGAGERAA